MKKKLLIILLSVACMLAFAFSFAACDFGGAGGNNPAEPNNPVDPDNPSTSVSVCKHENFDNIVHIYSLFNEPSCSEEGFGVDVYVCGNQTVDSKGVGQFEACGQVFEDEKAIRENNPVGRIKGAAVESKNSFEAYCKNYNNFYEFGKAIEKLPHTPVTDEAVSATCTKKGLTEGSHCGVCNAVIKAQEEIGFKHSYVNAVTFQLAASEELKACSDCGKVENKNLIFKLKLNADGNSYKITKAGGEDIIEYNSVPNTCNGMPITVIGELAYEKLSVTSIEIPDGITDIERHAFEYCYYLESINIPDTVKSIGYEAFSCCNGLLNITIPESVEVIEDGAFFACFKLVIRCKSVKPGWSDFWNTCNGNVINVPTIYNGADTDADGYTHATIDGIRYKLKNGRAVVAGQTAKITEAVIPESVTFNGETYSITEISSYAFLYCNILNSVKIFSDICSIAEYTFHGCTSLTNITLPDSVTSICYYAFGDCASLTSITIPDGVKSIESFAFSQCHALTSIVIPDSVTSIDSRAFSGCTDLQYNEYDNALYLGNGSNSYAALIRVKDKSVTSFTIHADTRIIALSAFSDCTDLQYNEYDNALYLGIGSNPYAALISVKDKSVTSFTIHADTIIIYHSAFYRCERLTSIIIPDSVTVIGESAFESCGALTSVTLPDGVTSIGNYAFQNCRALTGIAIPDGVTSIGIRAFFDCSSLRDITIPDNVKCIGSYAFYDCSRLTDITIPDSVIEIGESAFESCDRLTNITIPDSVIFIGPNAFKGCTIINATIPSMACEYITNLETVVITSGATIFSGAFRGFSYLTSVSLSDSVTSIGGYAFYDCSSLTDITIPDSVTSIGRLAFYNCTALTDITFGGTIEQWNAIEKGSNWDSNTGNYTIHCTDGDIEKS